MAKAKSTKGKARSARPRRAPSRGLTDTRAEALAVAARSFHAELKRDLVHLTPKRRRGMLRMPPRSAAILDLIVSLARERGLVQEPHGESRLEKNAALAKRLAGPVGAIGALHQALVDTMRVAQANAWSETTALYSGLLALGRVDVVLLDALDPARAFFKARRNARGSKAKRAPD